MLEQDYIMKMIRDTIKFLAKIVFNKDTIVYQLPQLEEYTQTDYLHRQLLSLIEKGKINEAENVLFEELNPENKKDIELALDFYERLNSLDDDFLEKNNFSREEIEQGLKAVAKKLGISI